MEIPYNLKTEIENYCNSNNITDVDNFIISLIKKGFSLEKYGDTIPSIKQKTIETKIELPIVSNVEEIKQESVIKKPNNDIYRE